MDVKTIKNDRNYFWTNHAKYKLLQYGLSPSAVKRTVNRPLRVENGIAPDTVAVMKRKDSKKIKKELWVMYQKFGAKIKIISAWIYPGTSPQGKDIYVPEDVWEEINTNIKQ
jgi:hypothetical protein